MAASDKERLKEVAYIIKGLAERPPLEVRARLKKRMDEVRQKMPRWNGEAPCPR